MSCTLFALDFMTSETCFWVSLLFRLPEKIKVKQGYPVNIFSPYFHRLTLDSYI